MSASSHVGLEDAGVYGSAPSAQTLAPPLCVALDGTLIRSNLFLELLLVLIKAQPWCILLLPVWLLRGRGTLKAEVAERVMLNPATLPYNDDLVRWLESQKRSGRCLWLCTASDERPAAVVAAYLNLFEGVLASTRDSNLIGSKKAIRLEAKFGTRGFDYCGNDRREVEVWRAARGAILMQRGDRVLRKVARHATVLQVFSGPPMSTSAVFAALRPSQWAKNVLVVVPMLASHRIDDEAGVAATLLAIVAFCLCASSVYVLNDLLDLHADRIHPRKSKRPFAAGTVPLSIGFLLAPTLLGAAWLVAVLLPAAFQVVLAIYCALTVAYSFALKGLVLIDVLTLACLYTLRVIGGTFAAGVPLSFWLLWFSMFLFLSLAFVKRYAELDALRRLQCLRAAGRDYSVEDLPALQSLGSTAGYLSVIVLALYINSPEINALYTRPAIIWMLCVLMLYWISRVWVKAQRGQMHDDPVVFALKDPISQVVGLLSAATVILAM